MSFEIFHDDPLRGAAAGALVLTATRRLERSLRRRFDQGMAAAGHGAWLAPAIESGDGWLKRAADDLGEGWRLLGAQAAPHLWERIIEADAGEAGRSLLQIGAAARLAVEAHSLLTEYRQNPSAYPLTADHASFLRWRGSYLETCRRHDWLDPAALGDLVAGAVVGGRLKVPEEVWLLGFDDLPPRFRRLAEALAGRGVRVHIEPLPVFPRAETVRIAAADPRDEVRLAALWVRRLLDAGEDEIGLIVPDLAGYRPLLERILREEIDPAAQVHPGAEELRFNLSMGVPLAGKGAVAAALEILGAGAEMPVAQAGFLLRTPYLGGAVREGAPRARRDRQLRASGQTTVALSSLAPSTDGHEPRERNPRAASFADICRRLLQAVREREKRLPGSWAQEFAQLLAAVGWPGERPLDSFDYQVAEAWREKVLRQLAAFDPFSGTVGRAEAVSLLRRLSAETLFQPEGAESPVQAVGLLEAAGLRFRHLWVMGLHDRALPAPPRPNPFLPVPLQVAAGMPHADAGREVDFARRVAERLLAAAPRVVLSHPLRDGDAALQPSPLIRDFPAGELDLPPSRAPIALWRAAAPAAEEVADVAGPPLPAGAAAAGGTAILRDQALCPFRAFARHRLGAAALEEPDIGLDPRERGSLLHKVLELFWQKTKDQAGLLALDGQGLEARLRETIATAIAELYEKRSRPAAELLELEQERLLVLTSEWLIEVEARRPPFEVLEEEKRHTEIFGGLEISTRIDRIDRLADDGLAVLDYKTGQVDVADLVGERLLEPQLAIYGVGRGGDELAAVAFAALRRGKCSFAGVAREGGLLPKVPAVADLNRARELGIADWGLLLAGWRQQLHDLGRAFAAGEAAIDPVSAEKACRYCDLVPLCRLNEKVSLPGDGGNE